MTQIDEKLYILEQKKEKVVLGGGKEALERQQKKGRNTARERITMLVDKDSFYEYDMFIRNRCSDFGLPHKDIPGEGIVTGHGKIKGRLVYVFSQDFTVMGGTLGEAHAEKMCRLLEKAIANGAPLIGINDSGGARIQEGMGALDGYTRVFFRNTMASGVVPQISVIMGPCAGGAVYSPALTDFVIMVKDTSLMFITGPDVIRAVTGEEITPEKLGGAEVHNAISGAAHFIVENEKECMDTIRKLLSFFPANSMEKPPRVQTSDSIDRMEEQLKYIVPVDPKKAYDVKDILVLCVDNGEFMEVHSLFARNIVVGFARLNGMSVGIIANQPKYLAGVLDINASVKAARFIRFCDAFNIPLLTLVDAPGYLPGVDQEYGGIIRNGAKMLYAYSEATVPKITVVLRKDYGGSYAAMCGKSLGADYVMAFPTAEIAVMGADGAVNIIYKKELEQHANPEKFKQTMVEEYRHLFSSPYKAAEWGLVNEVINPVELRPKLIRVLETFYDKKQEDRYKKYRKHGNIPL